MLTLENVSLNYGSFKALDGVTLHAKQGELVVLLGANGAGKSSIFLTISGIHRAAGGSIQYDGQQLIGRKPSAIVQAGVVQCPEGRKLFPMMSVQKNLMLGAYVHRRDGEGNRQRGGDRAAGPHRCAAHRARHHRVAGALSHPAHAGDHAAAG